MRLSRYFRHMPAASRVAPALVAFVLVAPGNTKVPTKDAARRADVVSHIASPSPEGVRSSDARRVGLAITPLPPTISVAANQTGLTASFQVTNNYASSIDIWAPRCARTGSVATCGTTYSPTSATLAPGQTITATVGYTSGAAGSGTLTMLWWHYVPGGANQQSSGVVPVTVTSLPPANLTVVASPPSVTTTPNGSGLVANFVITNPYATSTDVWAPSCVFTGSVTSCGNFTPNYYQIPAGQSRTMAVTYATGSPGNGSLSLAVWHYVPGQPNKQTSGTLAVTVTGSGPLDAPPIDSTTPSSLGQTAMFLYTGPNAIQTGVTPGSIDPLRTAVMRGRVLDTAGVVLSSVQVTVLDHPEWGQTSSRADGWFDFAYNGGGPVTVTYAKPGMLTVQRPLTLSWEQRGLVDTIVMTPVDTHSTTVTFAAPIQVARGSVVSDSLGTRQATVMFRQGTTATMRLPNGTTQPLTSLTVRATEFTLGSRGPMRMPGPLPPTSMFTYATEVSVVNGG